jgi:hypothetical protein
VKKQQANARIKKPKLSKEKRDKKRIRMEHLNRVRGQRMHESWDKLNNVGLDTRLYLAKVAGEVSNLVVVRDFEQDMSRETVAEYRLSLRTYHQDIERYTFILENMQSEHLGKTGLVHGEEEFVACIDLFERYSLLAQEMTTVLMPTMHRIFRFISDSEEERNRKLSVASSEPLSGTLILAGE